MKSLRRSSQPIRRRPHVDNGTSRTGGGRAKQPLTLKTRGSSCEPLASNIRAKRETRLAELAATATRTERALMRATSAASVADVLRARVRRPPVDRLLLLGAVVVGIVLGNQLYRS